MSRSEITAWQLGTAVESELRAGLEVDPARRALDWDGLTVMEQEARFRLGDESFAYWVLKGAQDAASVAEGG